MTEATVIALERVLGSITKARCSLCGVGFAQRYYSDSGEAERRMEEFFRRHVEESHPSEPKFPSRSAASQRHPTCRTTRPK